MEEFPAQASQRIAAYRRFSETRTGSPKAKPPTEEFALQYRQLHKTPWWSSAGSSPGAASPERGHTVKGVRPSRAGRNRAGIQHRPGPAGCSATRCKTRCASGQPSMHARPALRRRPAVGADAGRMVRVRRSLGLRPPGGGGAAAPTRRRGRRGRGDRSRPAACRRATPHGAGVQAEAAANRLAWADKG